MHRTCTRRELVRLCSTLLTWLALAAVAAAVEPEQRAVWANYRAVQTPTALAQTVERIAAARLNAIYVLVWYQGGQAAYRSALCPLMKDTPADHDPLGALIMAAHAKGIDVHAWFVNGSYGYANPGFVFTQHPDWELQTGHKTRSSWYDLGRPEVRQFERDVMLECLKNYDLDGIHFDYIRFDGHGMCFCAACQAEVQKRFGIPPAVAGGASFPLALQVSANPLGQPSTARVLATFDHGVPAIALNALGEGDVVLLNWTAVQSNHLAVTEFTQRILQRFGAAGGTVYQVRGSQTLEKYGVAPQQAGLEWLRGLGCKPVVVSEDQLATVPPKSTVVMQAQYYVTAATAEWLAGHVAAGGHALFLDGPVFAIREQPALQRLLGFTATAPYFHGLHAINPAPGQDLIPVGPPLDLEVEKQRDAAWTTFWTESVTALVRQVHRDAKALKPKTKVSAAVFYTRKAADGVCQDWYGWLKEGIIDYVVPMAYTFKNDDLKAALVEWQAADPTMAHIIPGLSIYANQGGKAVTRDLSLILGQQELCRAGKARGTCLFSMDQFSAELAAALAAGPYASPAPPYYPEP